MDHNISVEDAITKIMESEEGRQLVTSCYYDQDIISACSRFYNSEEWQEVSRYISKRFSRRNVLALDIGAGNGISSYAMTMTGFKVTAIEPDPSILVGYGAIRKMNVKAGLAIDIVNAYGERLPLPENYCNLVYLRQVLHHSKDLTSFLKEISRVLKPNGMLVDCREHVIDDEGSLQEFLSNHPLHKYTGSERAFTLNEYKRAITDSGMVINKIIGPWDSVINYYPISKMEHKANLLEKIRTQFGRKGLLLFGLPILQKWYCRRQSLEDRTPGRMFTFIATKTYSH